MIIELPFSYDMSGIEPKKRLPNSRTGIDVARVNIRDVPEDDCPVALTLLDEHGGHAEEFRHFEGSFWIKDSRADDVDFGKQHIMLMGHWPKKKQLHAGIHQNQRTFTAYEQEDADRDNETAGKGLSLVGLLRYKLTGQHSPFTLVDKEWQPKRPFFQADDGTVSCAIYDPSDTYRLIERNSVNEKRQQAVEYAQANTIAIDGVLWHRAPTPMIYATANAITWAFDGTLSGRLQEHSYGSYGSERADTSISGAYQMSMTEYDNIPDAFPDALEKQRVKFYIEYINPSFFEKPDARPLIIKDIKAATSKVGVLDESTPYVHKWLQLRDLIEAGGKKVAEQDDDFLDAAADILLELDAMLGKNSYPGAVMWVNRQVDLSFPTPDTPSGPSY
ncbi:hypothetical protein OIU34_22180 [Pararhizobium sp. BT-229]|uniref:hypothetical protein n=1 Tax=Pararhizobium sp. BT-229 TaxID=2986923 RepID=UPI0021F7DB12|nr:hypothetical protein [Pararhizobium sp. BT-229]MCV9964602.1 hypothetical protein [Pararhizobium sp. BT-229]